MESPSSRKRKANELDKNVVSEKIGSASDDAPEEQRMPHHLPAPVWGAILNHMPYDEVRSCLLISKMIATEAVKYVTTLNILNDYELDIPAARRFPSVEHVNASCLFTLHPQGRSNGRLSTKAARAVVPFLSSIPKLKTAFVGGRELQPRICNRMFYSPHMFRSPTDHRIIFLGLYSTLVGAYESRALSNRVEVKGLRNAAGLRFCQVTTTNESEPCEFCTSICKHLPVDEIIDTHIRCIFRNSDKFDIIRSRPNGATLIRNYGEKVLINAVYRMIYSSARDPNGDNTNATIDLTETFLAKVDDIVGKYNVDPSRMSKETFYRSFRADTNGYDRTEWTVHVDDTRTLRWGKDAIDHLKSRGFPFESNDLVVVDMFTVARL